MEEKNIEKLAEFAEDYLITQIDSLYYQIKKENEECKRTITRENLSKMVSTFVKYKNLREKAIEGGIFYETSILNEHDYEIKLLIKPYESLNSLLTLD